MTVRLLILIVVVLAMVLIGAHAFAFLRGGAAGSTCATNLIFDNTNPCNSITATIR